MTFLSKAPSGRLMAALALSRMVSPHVAVAHYYQHADSRNSGRDRDDALESNFSIHDGSRNDSNNRWRNSRQSYDDDGDISRTGGMQERSGGQPRMSRSGLVDNRSNMYRSRKNGRNMEDDIAYRKAAKKVREFIKENHVSRPFLSSLGIPYKSIVLDDSTASGSNEDSSEKDNAQKYSLDAFDLPADMVAVLRDRMKLSSFFPIQALTFSELRQHKDVIARSRTGTGKTLAFAIPGIEMILKAREEQSSNASSDSIGYSSVCRPRILVVTPTRELCIQVKEEFVKLGGPLGIRTAAVYGGASMDIQRQLLTGQIDDVQGNALSDRDSKNRRNNFRNQSGFNNRHGSGNHGHWSRERYFSQSRHRTVDVVVGTPGRLEDFITQGYLHLGQVKFLVLDEADRMLGDGFSEDMRTLVDTLSKHQSGHGKQQWQTCLFSATMPEPMLKIALTDFLKSAQRVFLDTVGDSPIRVATTIEQFCLQDESTDSGVRGLDSERDRQLMKIIETTAHNLHTAGSESTDDKSPVVLPRTIIFVERKRDADHYVGVLHRAQLMTKSTRPATTIEGVKSGMRRYQAASLHGDISQYTREQTLKRFRSGDVDCLVCTDVAARGIDVPNVDLVIQLEPPSTPESYIHRVGRTGRAGKKGTSVILFRQRSDAFAMSAIQEVIGSKLRAFRYHVKE